MFRGDDSLGSQKQQWNFGRNGSFGAIRKYNEIKTSGTKGASLSDSVVARISATALGAPSGETGTEVGVLPDIWNAIKGSQEQSIRIASCHSWQISRFYNIAMQSQCVLLDGSFPATSALDAASPSNRCRNSAGVCLSCFKCSSAVSRVSFCLSDAHNLGQDASILRTMLNLEEYRFSQWAKTVGLTRPDAGLSPQLNQTLTSELIGQLLLLLNPQTSCRNDRSRK